MKGRDIKGLGGPPSTDLLVCFPSRGHLSLMPKPICSPVKHSEPNKRHHHHQHHNLLKKINTKGGGGPASPLLWAKNKQMSGGGSNGAEIAEPTSPKVTCAGQIKVRPRPSAACKNWESVMEEIERIHNRSKHKKKSNWAGPLGFKKDIMNFLTCLRSIRLDFRCFGSFPEPDVITSDDEEEDEEEEEEYVVDDHEDYKEAGDKGTDKGSTVFSKWFMVLQENQQGNINGGELENDNNAPAVPPPNALLLMRCRSAPAKSWLEERENRAKKETEEQRKEETEKDKERENDEKKEEEAKVGQRKKKRESLAIVMKYDADFYNLSTDVAQETWLVGGLKDPFSRSRSWKR